MKPKYSGKRPVGLFLILLLMNGCIDDTAYREKQRLENAQSACLNSCPRGIEKFRIHYSDMECECRK